MSRAAIGRRVVVPAGLLAILASVGACHSSDIAAPSIPAATPIGDIPLAREIETIRDSVPARTTLAALLQDQGVGREDIEGVVTAAARVFDLRRLRSAQPYVLERTVSGEVRTFTYEIDNDRYLAVEPGRDEFVATLAPIEKTLEEAVVAGSLDEDRTSLFAAMSAAGERPELSIAMADIFSGEVDFNSDLQTGDRFVLAFDRYTREDGPATYGDIRAAELRNGGRTLRAIRFTPPGGTPAYYDEEGRSLKRFFLRSPLKFEPRITSGFTARRFHPVLHVYRAHLGVDYAAPTGAPVVAVASGVVVSATYDRANGRMVRLRHAGGYETYYLHLSAFGPGIRQGGRVGQGQVIGRVGATGLASGPHLDYRIRKNGTFVNPQREHSNMPPGEPLPASAMPAFEAARARASELFAAAEPVDPEDDVEVTAP